MTTKFYAPDSKLISLVTFQRSCFFKNRIGNPCLSYWVLQQKIQRRERKGSEWFEAQSKK
jgi:hypothetical protein